MRARGAQVIRYCYYCIAADDDITQTKEAIAAAVPIIFAIIK
jgi:translation initiation factor IF-2